MFPGWRPRICVAQLALVATAILLPVAAVAAQRAIAVGGRGSDADGAPGVFETARWWDEDAVTFRLPEIICTHITSVGWVGRDTYLGTYRQIEEAVYTEIKLFLRDDHDVVLIGYSHGAELILRVVNRLAEEGIDPQKFRRVRLALIDAVNFCYPYPTYFSVPAGTGGALHLYQLLFLISGGSFLAGASNIEVSVQIKAEREAAEEIILVPPPHNRFRLGRAGYHGYIEDSLTVRNAILDWLNVLYLGGIWSVLVDGSTTTTGRPLITVPYTFRQEFLLEYPGTLRYFKAHRETIYYPDGSIASSASGSTMEGEIIGSVVLVAILKNFSGTCELFMADFEGTVDRNRMRLEVGPERSSTARCFHYPQYDRSNEFTGRVEGERLFKIELPSFPTDSDPNLPANSVVNSASFRPATEPGGAIAPGAIVSLFGTTLASTTQVASQVPLPLTLGDTSVSFNGIAAPLFTASAGQINAQVPFEVPMGAVSVQIRRGSRVSAAQTVTVAPTSPGIFTLNQQGAGQGAVLISNTGIFAAPSGSIPGQQARPINRGEFMSLFCSGLGDVTNRPPSGAPPAGGGLSVTIATPTVTIGGVTTPVSFSGLTSFVGLYQVNVPVPANAPVGSAVPVVLSIGGVTSNTVTIAVE